VEKLVEFNSVKKKIKKNCIS